VLRYIAAMRLSNTMLSGRCQSHKHTVKARRLRGTCDGEGSRDPNRRHLNARKAAVYNTYFGDDAVQQIAVCYLSGAEATEDVPLAPSFFMHGLLLRGQSKMIRRTKYITRIGAKSKMSWMVRSRGRTRSPIGRVEL
jgi:hypothetical protein